MAKTAHRHCPEWPCNLKHMCASRVVGFDRSWYGVVAPITQVGVGGSHRSGWQVTGWWGGVWGRFSGCGIVRVWVFSITKLDLYTWAGCLGSQEDEQVDTTSHFPPSCLSRSGSLTTTGTTRWSRARAGASLKCLRRTLVGLVALLGTLRGVT